MAEAPKVSILLPSLNAREFLQPRIDSLFNQTFTDWEAIVLDSQSTDGTWEFFKSIASTDPRFRLHQIPREGLYAALNRGLDLANGEFLHIATCDDTMAPEFLSEMLRAFSRCPEAGIAASDVLLIDRDGNELSRKDLHGRLTKRAARNLLNLSHVRAAFPGEIEKNINYRPVPHDCFLHFDGRFETAIGSVADFSWLLQLTSSTGSVHVPRKLAMWRYHGNQLSLQPDPSRARSQRAAAEGAMRRISNANPILLSRNDRAALLLPLKILECRSPIGRVFGWFESVARLTRMFFERPIPTLRALLRVKFRFGTRRHSLLPMIFQGANLAPRNVE